MEHVLPFQEMGSNNIISVSREPGCVVITKNGIVIKNRIKQINLHDHDKRNDYFWFPSSWPNSGPGGRRGPGSGVTEGSPGGPPFLQGRRVERAGQTPSTERVHMAQAELAFSAVTQIVSATHGERERRLHPHSFGNVRRFVGMFDVTTR